MELGYDLVMDFGFCNLKIIDKNLTYNYRQEFTSQVNDKSFEHKVKKKRKISESDR